MMADVTLRSEPSPNGVDEEWLLTDGLGGYAMGTVAGLRSRRYHSLLTHSQRDGERRLRLLGLDPVLCIGGREVRLFSRDWVDGPSELDGGRLLLDFAVVDGVPRWRWQLGHLVVQRELAMIHGRSAIASVFRLVSGDAPVELAVWAVVPSSSPCETDSDGFRSDDLWVAGPAFDGRRELVRNVRHREEVARGLPSVADELVAGAFHASLAPGESVAVVARIGAEPVPSAGEIVDTARSRCRELVRVAGAQDEAEAMLVHAADQFVVGDDVIAGYPWFGSWSRDTLTAYEGLFLCTGRWEEGAAVLRRLAAGVDAGMLLNTTDFGGGEFNTVDAPLWLLYAAGRHWETTGDLRLARELLPGLESIVAGYRRGTRFGIRVDADGLVTQGAGGVALTWMDARVDGAAITPRAGKPVEVNALWVAGLWYLAAVQDALGVDSTPTWSLQGRARAAFGRFVAPAGLFDVIDGPAGDDASLRPNQLLAGVRHGPFAGTDGRIERGWAEHLASACAPLVTPVGLRSLGPDEPDYAGRFEGDMPRRDSIYHQGTVWPWLIGPWVDVATAAGRDVDLGGLIAQLTSGGLGSVPEVADGDPPHRPGGCPFQAWSVAELLRVLIGDRRPQSSSSATVVQGSSKASATAG